MPENEILTPDELINLARDGCLLEAEMLANVTESGHFRDILPYFSDYSGYIRKIQASPVSGLLPDYNIIDLAYLNEELLSVFSCAHLAAVCYLFSGFRPKQSELNRGFFRQYAQSYAHELIGEGALGVRTLLHRLHNTDAIRTIQALKLLGLLRVQSDTCKQLSLGAGHGSRDLHSIHQIPAINCEYSGGIISRDPGEKYFKFESTDVESSNIVLIDNDPDYEDYYKNLNSIKGSHITALNMGLEMALNKLQSLLAQGDAEPRNLIAAFRIDHNMIPDVEHLLSLLYLVIDDECDFILSVGAGFSIEEFGDRLEKIHEFSEILAKLNIKTTRIKLYAGSTLDEKRANLAFGSLNIATYELLYCKLTRKQLRPMQSHQ